MSMQEHKQNHLSTTKTNSWGAGNKHQFLIPLLFLCMLTLAASAFADHTPSSTLQPEWSQGNATVNYTVTISSQSNDNPIDEVRIIKSSGYTNFNCQAKTGWHMIFVSPWYDGEIGMTEMCWYYTTVPANNIPGGGSEQFNFSATVPEPEQCNLKWKFETRDEVTPEYGSWETTYAYTHIDSTDPTVNKTVTGPQSMNGGLCPNGPAQGQECWITQSTTITVCSEDQGNDECQGTEPHSANTKSGVDHCIFQVTLDGTPGTPWTVYDNQTGDNDGDAGEICHDVTFVEDSLHELSVTCYDKAGNDVSDIENFRVDDTPPVTTKDISEPKKIEDGVEWVDGVTKITLSVVDPESPTTPAGVDCSIGVKETKYLNILAGEEEACRSKARCDEMNVPSVSPEEWKTYDGTPITKEEESCHVLFYYSEDELGNKEDIKVNCFFVDKTPPEVLKSNGDAILDRGEDVFITPENQEGAFHWITKEMPVTFRCDDSRMGEVPHPSGDEELCFKVSYDYPGWGYITERYCSEGEMNKDGYCCVDATMEDPFEFYFQEESMHNLEYYCIDAVEKKSDEHIQYYKVDDTPPSITKDMLGSFLGDCPSGTDLEHGDCYVADNGESGVTITVEDGGEICAVGVDYCIYALWWLIDDKPTCIDKYGPTAWDGFKCLVENDRFSEEVSIYFKEDSTHKLYVNCFDMLGNKWDGMGDVEFFLVDSTPPETTKEYGTPTKVKDGYRWITSNTPITLKVKDEKVGIQEVNYKVTLQAMPEAECMEVCNGVGSGDFTKVDAAGAKEFSTEFKIAEESCHFIEFYTTDLLGNIEQTKSQCVFVDNTAPTGIKEVGEPKIECDPIEGKDCWWVRDPTVAEPTLITLDCEDQGNHPVEQETVCYRVSFDDQATPYLTGQYCAQFGGVMEDDWCCEYVGDDAAALDVYELYFMEDSLHDLEFYCMDHLGNTEATTDKEWFRVDSIPPTTIKTYIPEAYTDPSTGWEYIDTVNEIELSAVDGGDVCHVDGVKTYYRYTLVDDEMCEGECLPMQGNYDWQFGFGSGSAGSWGYVLGPDTPPMGEGSAKFVLNDSSTGVELGNSNQEFRGVKLSDIHTLEYSTYVASAAGPETIALQLNMDYDCTDLDTGWQGRLVYEPYYNGTVEQGKWQTWDALAGKWWASGSPGNTYFPQSGPATWSAVLAQFPNACIRDTEYTGILLKAGSGWAPNFEGYADKVVFNDETYNFEETGAWSKLYDTPFGIPEESCHLIEFYSEDALGNKEEVQYQCVFVDKTPPITLKDYEGPQYSGGLSEYPFFQTTTGDQAVDIKLEDLGDSIKWTIDFPIDDDTCNGLMAVGLIIATDDEGNGPVFQIHNNDGTDSGYNWGTWLMSPYDNGWHSSSINTLVTALDWVEATGGRYREGKSDCPEPNPEGIFTITIDKSELGEDFHWALYTAIGQFCEHAYQQATYPNEFGWGEPIVTSTNYEYAESVKGEYPKWITSDTEIWLTATDPDPHPAGLKETKYRVSLVADGFCDADTEVDVCDNAEGDDILGGWQDYTGTVFNIPEESCHLIEYYSVDNVDKTEDTKKQCVYVDNTAPTPDKKVGEPNNIWTPTEQDITTKEYKYLANACWNADPELSIDCWEVTLLTPIELACDDSWDGEAPHPVGNETVCFYVELDADDATEAYCTEKSGNYNANGENFCCMEKGFNEFYFHEESEHNLQYYCEDALGNIGPKDDEKFKVRGTTIEIQLNKKWNLISVPFTLLNNNVEDVFSDVVENVDSVWTYDPNDGCDITSTPEVEHWCVYRPNVNPALNNLEEINPGWGYWVAAYNNDTLLLGGEVSGQGGTGMESRSFEPGTWNLIGLYGWGNVNPLEASEAVYNGPDLLAKGKTAYCALYSLGTNIFDKEFSALLTYWEPDNPLQEKYLDQYNYMNPGAGYWLFTPVGGGYSFTTTCGPTSTPN